MSTERHPEADSYDMALDEIAKLLRNRSLRTQPELESAKIAIVKRHALARVPSNSEVLAKLNSAEREAFGQILRVKATRSASGVVVVAVMSGPAPCPHGRCVYCPGGPSEGTPQSYTGHEPAAMRGAEHGYDPYLQVTARLEQLRRTGHPVHKVEIIVMGGTFPSRPEAYQRDFVKKILNALNGVDSNDLETAKALAETAPLRNVGLTVETRPDYCEQKHVDLMLDYTTTRVEIGVQTVFPDILESVGRCHTVQDSIGALRVAKDAGLKTVVHMMPGLPGSFRGRDLEAFRTIFSDANYKPDMLKVYPTLVIKGTKLFNMWKRGDYKPLDQTTSVEIVAEILAMAPPWVRVMRVQRDIPAKLIQAGPRRGNLRELALQRLEQNGRPSQEIRCREAGLVSLRSQLEYTKMKLSTTQYDASGGKEFFLSWESEDGRILFGYLRMRLPSSQAHRPEIKCNKSAIVRELKVLGTPAPLGRKADGSFQHIGLGRSLMREAEQKASESGVEKLLVTAAIGVRRYYYSLGYYPDGPYVSRPLN